MLRVVAPAAVATAVTAVDVVAVPTVDVCVTIIIVIIIYRDVVIAAPAAVAPAATPSCSHGHSDSKRNRHARRVVAGRRIVDRWIWVNGGTVDYRRVIARNINNLWVCLLNNHNGLALDNLRLYLHLLTGFQVPRIFCFCPHALDRIHHVGLLRQKRVSQICRPLDVICQTLDEIRNWSHGLDAGVPRLLGHCIGKSFVLQILVLFEPLLKLDDFQWIRRSR